jgi:hypothetical protein
VSQLKVGSYEISALETGRFALDGGAMFGVVPKNLWSRTNPPDEQNRIGNALSANLIKGECRKIMVYTSLCEKNDDKTHPNYKLDK